jgi:hypothetical protein
MTGNTHISDSFSKSLGKMKTLCFDMLYLIAQKLNFSEILKFCVSHKNLKQRLLDQDELWIKLMISKMNYTRQTAQKFVVHSLYGTETHTLPGAEQKLTKSGNRIKTLGEIIVIEQLKYRDNETIYEMILENPSFIKEIVQKYGVETGNYLRIPVFNAPQIPSELEQGVYYSKYRSILYTTIVTKAIDAGHIKLAAYLLSKISSSAIEDYITGYIEAAIQKDSVKLLRILFKGYNMEKYPLGIPYLYGVAREHNCRKSVQYLQKEFPHLLNT